MAGLGQRVVFSAQEFVEVGSGMCGDSNDYGSCGEIAQALAVAAKDAGDPPDEIEGGQGIDDAEQVADDDLRGLQAEAAGIHHAEIEQALADGLTAPDPFGGGSVDQSEREIQDDVHRAGHIFAKKSERAEELLQYGIEHGDDREIDGEGQHPAEGSGQRESELDAFRGTDDERIHFESGVEPARAKKSVSSKASTRPKAIFMP